MLFMFGSLGLFTVVHHAEEKKSRDDTNSKEVEFPLH